MNQHHNIEITKTTDSTGVTKVMLRKMTADAYYMNKKTSEGTAPTEPLQAINKPDLLERIFMGVLFVGFLTSLAIAFAIVSGLIDVAL